MTRLRSLLLSAALLACGSPEAPSRRILSNDNLVAAGRSFGTSRILKLDIREGDWYPESDTGLSEPMLAFAEQGKAPQIPGPLVRVIKGTTISASIVNRSPESLVLHGLGPDSVLLPPDSAREVRFTADRVGTWYYWATPPGQAMTARRGIHSQLSGAFVVDSVGAGTRDRIFVLGEWNDPIDTTGPKPWVPRDLMTINGRMWPYTERFSYTEGDSVAWRWINTSQANHPMHLHGFYFAVTSKGNGQADSLYAPSQVRHAVTETLTPGQTMTMAWQAERAGNWLFHCHFAFHVSHFLSLHKIPDPDDPGSADAMSHSPHMMTGLVLGLVVKPKTDLAARLGGAAARRVRIVAREVKGGAGYEERYHYFVQGDGRTLADSADATVMLQRGHPVEFTIVNALRAPTAVHWHGIELEDSYVDGVPDWSGYGTHVAPSIAPGDSFTVRFTPPRSGTFMYHSHWNEIHQIAHGLYGALLVTDDAAADTAHERVFTVGGDERFGFINRQAKPSIAPLSAGERYRFRLVNIHGGSLINVALMADSTLLDWRPLAKDGADLPPFQSTASPARVTLGPGEIIDVEVMVSREGMLRLDVVSPVEGWTTSARIMVLPRR